VLTAVQAAILDTTLPTVEYTGSVVLEDIEGHGVDDIPLQFDINKLKLVHDKKRTSKKIELKDFLVYTPFLLYTSSFKPGNCLILCDPSSELCTLIKNRCEVISGSDGSFYALTFTSAIPFQDSIFNEVTKIAKRRHNTIWNAVKKYQESLRPF